MSNHSDVIVIGAGFAGLVASRELSRRGHSVTVLEGRDRIAGRTHLEQRLGRDLELGGTWVHWTQPYVWAEMGRYGIEPVPGAEFTKAYWHAQGQRHEGTADELMDLLDAPNQQLLAEARRYFPLPWSPLANPEVSLIDSTNLSEAIEAMDLPEAQRQLLRSFWALNFNGKLDEAAYSQALRWAAVASGSWQLMFEACASFKIEGGTRRLAQAILEDSTAEVHLGQQVRAVRQDDDLVVVTTDDGSKYSTKKLIVTVPLNVLAHIEFQPELSTAKRAAAERGQVGMGAKLWIRVKGVHERFVVMGPENAPLNFAQVEYTDAQTTTLVCFGPDAGAVDVHDKQAAQMHLDQLVPGLEVVAIAGHNWVDDEYSRSTWPMHKAGYLSGSLAELQKPEGRIHLAGSDYANGWGGFIDGAIESGISAARTVLRELAGEGSAQNLQSV